MTADAVSAPVAGKGDKAAIAVRRAARDRALQLLYAYEQNKYQDDGRLLPSDDEPVAEAVSAQAEAWFNGFIGNRVPIDAAIDKRLTNWTIHRLAAVDRNILRLGAYEILYDTVTPPKVAINEAVEMAKRFGSEDKTAKLVNAVLDRLAKDHPR